MQVPGAVAITLILWLGTPTLASGSPWGANYFPNVPLVTQDGESVLFFDDLIQDKIVVINFIYTSCVDTCPLETAQLTKVQEILGDRLGDDVFFYSISIDPDHDTPAVLKAYADRFNARWTFLTGQESDVVLLRKKLGLYIAEIQDGSNNHNVSMIIGNQATGRWMKRSPFENPYVLADQIGNWLDGWKSAPQGDDFANAPALRPISTGEQLFRTRCAICHSISGEVAANALGPDLLGVTRKRDPDWLANWLRAPDQMLKARDPIALALFKQYNEQPMPNLRLSRVDVTALIDYMGEESTRVQMARRSRVAVADGVVAIEAAWIRESQPGATANAGYMTLTNLSSADVKLVGLESPAFEKIEMHEMVMRDELRRMQQTRALTVPSGGRTEFAPGGRHMMMIGRRQRLSVGQNVPVTLVFDSGRKQTVTARIAKRAP